MLPLRARVNLGALAMKGYSTLPKAPALLEPHHEMGESYPSAEKQSVYRSRLGNQRRIKPFLHPLLSIAITYNLLRPELVVPVRDPFMGQEDLFINYSYSIRPCTKKAPHKNNKIQRKKQKTKQNKKTNS